MNKGTDTGIRKNTDNTENTLLMTCVLRIPGFNKTDKISQIS